MSGWEITGRVLVALCCTIVGAVAVEGFGRGGFWDGFGRFVAAIGSVTLWVFALWALFV